MRIPVSHIIYKLIGIPVSHIISKLMRIPVSQEGKPHVVLVIADDMGYNDIGYYNQFGDIKTPHLDKLATLVINLSVKVAII